MRAKQLKILGCYLVVAACVLALWRLWPGTVGERNSSEPVAQTVSGVARSAQAEGSAKGRRKLVTAFTVEGLSEELERAPTSDEWRELTRILLHAESGDLVEAVKARFSLHAGPQELAALAEAYQNPVNDDTRQRIMEIFSTLQSADFPETARRILTNENLPITDHLVCACALSLVRHGQQEDILAIFKRLNAAGEDPEPEGSLYPETSGLLYALSEARNPNLVHLFMDVAAGRGVATTGQARMAAAAALRNYHTVPVTEVLYELSKNETNPQVRKQAERSLKAIQTNE